MKWREATFQKNDSEDDPGSWKKNGENARNVYQRSRNTKAQANRDEQHTRRINNRIMEAEEWINDLEDGMVEITVWKT